MAAASRSQRHNSPHSTLAIKSLLMNLRLNSRGFGLIQVILLIVVLGLAVTAGLQVATNALDESRRQDTIAEMQRIADAIAGNPELYANGARLDFGYVGDVGNIPASLENLVSNPGFSTWRGPYLPIAYSNYADDYRYDAWGGSYLLLGNRVIAVDPSGDTLSVMAASSVSQLLGNSISGTITNSVGDEPGSQAVNIRVVLTYPDGSGSARDSILIPAGDGSFSFDGFVPCGNHRVRAILTTASDTSEASVSVLPGSTINVVLRLGSLPVAHLSNDPTDAVYALRSDPLSTGRST